LEMHPCAHGSLAPRSALPAPRGGGKGPLQRPAYGRENAMRRWLFGLIALASAPALAQQVPQISYESVPNFLKLPPDMHLGEAAGVAVNSQGHIFVFSRGGSSQGPAFGNTAAQLYEFAPDGQFIREIGKNLYAWSFAHTVRIDKDDNIW